MSTAKATIEPLIGEVALGELSKYCNKLKNGAEKQLCKKFADEDLHTLLKMILSIFEPKLFCDLVDAC